MIFIQMLLSLLFSCFALIPAQSGDAVERRFAQLSEAEQLEVVSDLTAQLVASKNIVVHRAGELLQLDYKSQAWRPRHALYVFDHSEYAPRLKLKYREYTASQSKWKKIGRVSLPGGVPEESPALRYDHVSKGMFVPELSHWGSTLSNLSKGSCDELTLFSAPCEGVLDYDPVIGKSADYFAHTYRDRDGNVYSGVRLYDVWGSQSNFGISDVEGVAFLRNVLDEHRIESPIDDRYHSKLYQRISDHFDRWREYRQLHHTLSMLQINPNARIDLLYEGLRQNFNMAWRMLQFDPRRMAAYLKKNPNRTDFIAAISEDLQAVIQPELGLPLPVNYEINKLASETAIAEIVLLANTVLRNHGLLGLRR